MPPDTNQTAASLPTNVPDTSEESRLSVREWPAAERPRERLRDLGPAHLSTAGACCDYSAHRHAGEFRRGPRARIARQAWRAGGLAQANFRQLTQYPGLGEAKVAQLKAALELGRRAAASTQPERPIIRSVADAMNYLLPDFVDEEQEKFLVVLLDTKHRVVSKVPLYRGTLNQTAVRPAEVFREAVRANCGGGNSRT